MNQIAPKLRPHGTACPGWHRFRLGGFEITAISDGQLPLRATSGFEAAPPDQIEALLRENFLPTQDLMLGQNTLLVNTGQKLVLIDSGMGDSMGDTSHMFGPSPGHMLETLRNAGFAPQDIDMVILTHAHADHAWGLAHRDGSAVFPNAELALAESELDFWTNPDHAALSPFADVNVRGAIANITPYRDRLLMVRDGAEVCAGITALACPGHSIGHHGYILESQGQTMASIGDLAHHHILALRRPDWEISYDSDPAQAVRSRRRVLDMLAAERMAVTGYHFPWPGLGHVARRGDGGFDWVATPVDTWLG